MAKKHDIKIMVIDDDPTWVKLLETYINSFDRLTPTFFAASDLATGLRKIRVVDPDVLLLDLSLPDSVEDKTVGRVKQMYPDIPIVIISVTHFSDAEIAPLGVEGYIYKPDLSKPQTYNKLLFVLETHAIRKRIKKKFKSCDKVVRLLENAAKI